MNSQPFRRRRAPLVIVALCALLAANIVARPQGAGPGARLDAIQGRATQASLAGFPLVQTGEPSPRAAFAALQQRAGGALDVHWDARAGIADFLTSWDPAARIPYMPTAAERGNPVAVARGFLDENRALFRLGGVTGDLAVGRVEPDHQLGFTHVRMAQVYQGIPVFGKQLVVHLDPQERIVAVNGHVAPAIDVPAQPSIGQDLAEQVALRDLLETQLRPDERARVTTEVLKDKTSLMVYVDQNDRATLTWYVTIMTNTPLGQWRYFVNARRPVVVHGFDSAADAMRRITFTARNGTDLPGRQLIDEGERSRDPVAQAAQDGGGKVYAYYYNTFKRDGIDGQGSPMISTVHYGSDPQDAENAAWIGELAQMIYGDGGRIFKPLAYGLDVIGHEMTHGVIDSTSQLIYQGQSGALNEGYADIFGALIEGQNWIMGETIIKSPPYPLPYLRSLEDPNAQGHYDPSDPLAGIGQPATMSQYANLPLSRRADNGGVHINSGIPAHAAFLVAQAIGKQKMEQIFYRTMTQYLTPDANFLDNARALVRAATDLFGPPEVEGVRNAFNQVGLNVAGNDTGPAPPSSTPTLPQGPAAPAPAPTLPAGCKDIVTSGGFESDNGWTQVAAKTNTGLIDTELPHSGKRSAWLGGTDEEPLQYIYQDVSIPANATRVQLTYYRLVHQETTGVLGLFAADARFNVLLATTKGDVIAAIEKLSSTQGDDKWRQASADLSQLAGKTVRLTFSAENPRRNVSSMFVDDVALVVCTTGEGPAAPPTSSQDQVYIQGKIKNADTGRGVEGAQVFIIKPGLSATQAAADDAVRQDEVATLGVTDGNGVYQTEAAVARGQTYSVIIIASGFRPIVADDGVAIESDAGNPFEVNATLRRAR